MSGWPEYQSSKVIRAMRITNVTTAPTGAYPVITIEDGAPFSPTEIGMSLRCAAGDYAMLYPDGFRSVCPKEAFEANYKKV